MLLTRAFRCIALLTMGSLSFFANNSEAAPSAVDVRTDDVELFYRVYDAAHGLPSGEVLQRDYINAGSDGVRQFVPNRIKSGEHLAGAISKSPAVYSNAKDCMRVLPEVQAKLAGAFQRLAEIDPRATFPPVTILVGANNSGGTTGKSGVLIGLEVACRSSWLQSDPAERLYHLIAHEYGHVEQFPEGGEHDSPETVLKQSLVEGGAELIAELISGQVSNAHLQRWTRGRGRQIGERFIADEDSKDLSTWLYNGVGTPENPGDLGYWIGYQIAKEYYLRAPNKHLAIQNLLELRDPKAILAESGWSPEDRH